MDSGIVIDIRHISKEYLLYGSHIDRVKEVIHPFRKSYHHTFSALTNISFKVKKGEFFGIIGRNGCGKSTLLQLICGIMQPSAGTINVRGRIAALLELGAGFNPEFTGQQNVYLNGALLGFNRNEMDNVYDEIVEFADIGEFIDQPVKMYSSGMYVRLAFAVQACVEPDVLVIDEALAVGDIFFRQKCYKRLQSLLDRGCTVLLVSHAMNDVEQFCQRVLLLHAGEELFLGPAGEAVKRYYLVEQEGRQVAQVVALESKSLSSEPPPAINSEGINGNLHWPSPEAFLDISHVKQVSNGWARCTSVAVCDPNGNARFSFQQGETASFFYEFELLKDIAVPTGGLEIINDKGVIVHGKSTLEYGSDVPEHVSCGQILKFRQNIKLEVAPGEYIFNLGMGTLPLDVFNNRKNIHPQELDCQLTKICTLPTVGQFNVQLPTSSSRNLLHYGIANLQGSCKVMLV